MAGPIQETLHNVTTSIHSFPRISTFLRRKFCAEISPVVLGIRTAYLLDLFSLSEATALDLANTLHSAKAFVPLKNLRLLFHRGHEQVFFVNVDLLGDRVMEARSPTPWTSFISLTPSPIRRPGVPTEVLSACDKILAASSSFDTSLSSLSAPHAIALAGFLLEYPFSYIPSDPEQHTFLQGVPLCVVECFLVSGDKTEHPLMKFSYPLSVHDEHFDGDNGLIAMIKRRFEARLGPTTGWTVVRVACETKTLDRVAL